MNKKILEASISEITNGFSHSDRTGVYSCLFCNAKFESGVIYPVGSQLMDARKAAQLHIKTEHGSVFSMLLSEDKKYTGLTDIQKDLLQKFYDGVSDKDIAKATNTSPSTVRYQRFSFREKAKQAKVTLAISELLESKCGQGDEVIEIHEGAKMVDERYMTTGEEAEKITKNFFESLNPLILKSFPAKEKNKLVILKIIAKQFNPAKKYSEKQVNEILRAAYDDYATIRRFLIDYGFLGRSSGGMEYWVRE